MKIFQFMKKISYDFFTNEIKGLESLCHFKYSMMSGKSFLVQAKKLTLGSIVIVLKIIVILMSGLELVIDKFNLWHYNVILSQNKFYQVLNSTFK